MKEYNIYFSYNSQAEYSNIMELIKEYTANFSIISVVGYYGGKCELSKCLRIVDLDNSLYYCMRSMANDIKKLGNQESVLLTSTIIEGKLI